VRNTQHLGFMSQHSCRRLTCSALRTPCAAPLLQTLYESSIAFGMRKALMTEQGKGEMETHITQLQGNVKDLERQVRERSAATSDTPRPASRQQACWLCSQWCLSMRVRFRAELSAYKWLVLLP
jgi:hypothetical protein